MVLIATSMGKRKIRKRRREGRREGQGREGGMEETGRSSFKYPPITWPSAFMADYDLIA